MARRQLDARERLDNALHIIARIVVLHGDKYLPLFERLERDRAAMDAVSEARQRAIKLAGAGYDTRSSQ